MRKWKERKVLCGKMKEAATNLEEREEEKEEEEEEKEGRGSQMLSQVMSNGEDKIICGRNV